MDLDDTTLKGNGEPLPWEAEDYEKLKNTTEGEAKKEEYPPIKTMQYMRGKMKEWGLLARERKQKEIKQFEQTVLEMGDEQKLT